MCPVNHHQPVAVFKALGDPSRLAMVLLIRAQQELCVCELTTALDVAQPKVSRHLSTLRDAGLLEGERRGQWIYYQLHPQLPDWVIRVIDEAAEPNRKNLNAEMQRLANMPDRPMKTDCA
ncbi:metalloregulator ArsR/SmtB family transcription factor [Marinobacter sediminum]|uniref:metalloregulator ArsR/SmtB family transcription factor n=1 Tax=Marinobacter sediminum TaxID=256323 RepID=UPI00202F862B|nr:metalloregulator ArsR/SmtB family transcription factor [Marinobacter sediminum]MCM0613665.1 metalloregulator ArsR/SmtB family transcription factor [Marinobacter sediminum]